MKYCPNVYFLDKCRFGTFKGVKLDLDCERFIYVVKRYVKYIFEACQVKISSFPKVSTKSVILLFNCFLEPRIHSSWILMSLWICPLRKYILHMENMSLYLRMWNWLNLQVRNHVPLEVWIWLMFIWSNIIFGRWKNAWKSCECVC